MNNVEKRLVEEKQLMESITAPEELEMRLRDALNAAAPKRKKRIAPIWKIAAVIVFALVVSGNNYNAFAYYGKQLFGFDDLIEGTLKQLNDKGMGQMVEKTTKLEDGTELIINGIMSDANQLVMYYTLNNPNGLDDHYGGFFSPRNITGFLTKSSTRSGMSVMNENQTEIKGSMSFDNVSPFSKELTLHFWQSFQNGVRKESTVSFPYDPNKAMQTEIKQSINKKFKVNKGTITFQSITATPMMTVINGKLNVENLYKVDNALGGIELKANGHPIAYLGSGTQSSFGGTEFYIHFDSLPEQLDKLELVIKEFAGYQKLEEKISLASFGDEAISLNGKELRVKDVSTTADGVEVTIVTDEDVRLEGVSIDSQAGITPLKTTVNQNSTMQADGRWLKERTLLFDTINEPEYLLIEGMHYMSEYNGVIEIPVSD
ncbi:hypothetical protein BK133_13265 [Paenibacillus sp. FSL H8-0548]|uniref:DUF4179 domain-containing protein n=1 Tax=Paenibacillus sp. FSL H8-0548 TaxID=1920422 RepID=UPI00096F6B8C|nr:DUF4179 domain-containing protein [Paenibacillus sp. FSL H8-0548]OMF33756.1 hypothetical protein BK133_13265 [Paenibacillus sp. FSL H8-0548]